MAHTVKHPNKPAPPATPVQACNYVCKTTSNRTSNARLGAICLKGRTDSKVFPSCNVSDYNPAVSYSIFGNNGLQIACGASHPYHALWSILRNNIRLAEPTGSFLRICDFRCENIVSSVGVGHYVNLDLLYKDNNTNSVFQPTIFSGLKLSPRNDTIKKPIKILFHSGKGVITGCNYPDEPIRIAKELVRDLKPYEWGNEYRQLPDDQYEKRKANQRKAAVAATPNNRKPKSTAKRMRYQETSTTITLG